LSTQSEITGRQPGAVEGIVLLLPITLTVLGIVVLVPVLPLMMAQFAAVPNHEYWIQGGVLTMPALCVMLFSPLAGWAADRYGRRQMLLWSMGVYAFVGIAPIFLDNLFAIVASRVAVGVCEAVLMTTSTTMISDYFRGHEREKWLASQTGVAALSALLLLAIGGWLGGRFGWRGPFGVYLFSLVLSVAVWKVTRNVAIPFDSSSVASTERMHARESPFVRILGICAITLVASVMFYAVQTQGSLALTALGVHDTSRIGLLTALVALGVPTGTVLFRAVTKWHIGVLLAVEFALIGAGFLLMGRAIGPYTFVAASALNQIGCGMILPTLLTWATRGLSYELRGRGTGTWNGTFTLGQFLSGIVITFLGARVGGLMPAFLVLGFAALVCTGIALAVQLRRGFPTRIAHGLI
jgi:MFS family permease